MSPRFRSLTCPWMKSLNDEKNMSKFQLKTQILFEMLSLIFYPPSRVTGQFFKERVVFHYILCGCLSGCPWKRYTREPLPTFQEHPTVGLIGPIPPTIFWDGHPIHSPGGWPSCRYIISSFETFLSFVFKVQFSNFGYDLINCHLGQCVSGLFSPPFHNKSKLWASVFRRFSLNPTKKMM